jgi:hypothetical protein
MLSGILHLDLEQGDFASCECMYVYTSAAYAYMNTITREAASSCSMRSTACVRLLNFSKYLFPAPDFTCAPTSLPFHSLKGSQTEESRFAIYDHRYAAPKNKQKQESMSTIASTSSSSYSRASQTASTRSRILRPWDRPARPLWFVCFFWSRQMPRCQCQLDGVTKVAG